MRHLAPVDSSDAAWLASFSCGRGNRPTALRWMASDAQDAPTSFSKTDDNLRRSETPMRVAGLYQSAAVDVTSARNCSLLTSFPEDRGNVWVSVAILLCGELFPIRWCHAQTRPVRRVVARPHPLSGYHRKVEGRCEMCRSRRKFRNLRNLSIPCL